MTLATNDLSSVSTFNDSSSCIPAAPSAPARAAQQVPADHPRRSTYERSPLGDATRSVVDSFKHVAGGLGEAKRNWQANTNDSDEIIKYGALGIAAVLSLGLVPKAFSFAGWEGGGLVSGSARFMATVAIAGFVAGTAAGLAGGKTLSDAMGDTLMDIGTGILTVAGGGIEMGMDFFSGEPQLPVDGETPAVPASAPVAPRGLSPGGGT